MCGIIGIYRKSGLTSTDVKEFFRMMVRCEKRGSDASGAFNQHGDFIKTAMRSSDLVRMRAFVDFLKKSKGCKYIVGHCRHATRGSPKFIFNDHPVFNKRKTFFLVHNGTVSSSKYDHDDKITDTWIFINAISAYIVPRNRIADYLSSAVKESFKELSDEGGNRSVVVVGNKKELVFARSNAFPLVWKKTTDGDGERIVFGSEIKIVDENARYYDTSFTEMQENTVSVIDVKTGDVATSKFNRRGATTGIVDDECFGIHDNGRLCGNLINHDSQTVRFPRNDEDDADSKSAKSRGNITGWGFDGQGNFAKETKKEK